MRHGGKLSFTTTSMFKKIRQITDSNIKSDWYLIFFSQTNLELTFLLINDQSREYEFLRKYNLHSKKNIFPNQDLYEGMVYFLEKLMNMSDITSFDFNNKKSKIKLTKKKHSVKKNKQLTNNYPNKSHKELKNTGKNGEKRINSYLIKEKKKNKIKNFTWLNQNIESKKPYDFMIHENSGKKIFIDAKSTSYQFNQPIYISENEIKFIRKKINNYYIYRVYDLDGIPKMKRSRNLSNLIQYFDLNYQTFKNKLKDSSINIRGLNLQIVEPGKTIDFEPISDF